MRTFKLLVAAAGLAIAVPACATVINFDTAPGGTIADETAIAAQYAALGVSFSASISGAGGAPTATTISAGQTNAYYSGNYLANRGLYTGPINNYLLATRYDLVSVLFSATVSGVSFGLNTFATVAPVTVNAYDANGALLQSRTLNEGGGWALDSLSASGIGRIDFVASRNYNNTLNIFGIDQLSFTQDAAAPVPEPAAWAMMVGGFGLIGGMLRRRGRIAVSFG